MNNLFFDILAMSVPFFLIVFHCVLQHSIQSDNNGFNDTVLFSLNWPGKLLPEDEETAQESIVVTSSHQEKYKCTIPTILEKETSHEEKYSGPSALELLSPLFTQSLCSFKLESYWTYEVCSCILVLSNTLFFGINKNICIQ